MTIAQLKACLRRARPVIVMLQAWGEDKRTKDYRKSYKRIWRDGHWVVAIGFDRTGVYFEDPSMQKYRGFLTYTELDERWHDWGPKYQHMHNFEIEVWQSRRGPRPRERGRASHFMRIP